MNCLLVIDLESDLQSDLPTARLGDRAGNRTEGRTGYRCTRNVEDGMVEGIVNFGPELDSQPLRNFVVPYKGEIQDRLCIPADTAEAQRESTNVVRQLLRRVL